MRHLAADFCADDTCVRTKNQFKIFLKTKILEIHKRVLAEYQQNYWHAKFQYIRQRHHSSKFHFNSGRPNKVAANCLDYWNKTAAPNGRQQPKDCNI
jgi:hypothetical protein